jgi:hypothetical protein
MVGPLRLAAFKINDPLKRRLPMARVWPPIKNLAELIHEEDMDVELPPAPVQEHLLQLYFTYIHPVFPVIHKTRFLTEYNTRYAAIPYLIDLLTLKRSRNIRSAYFIGYC